MFAFALPLYTMAFSRSFFLVLACGMALVLSACVLPPVTPAMPRPVVSGADLVGTEWVAVQIAGVDTVAEPAPRLRWTGAEQVAGSGGCNAFFGRAVVQQGALLIGPLGATGRMCLSLPEGGQEDRFFKALESARGLRQNAGELWLEDGVGRRLLLLVAKP